MNTVNAERALLLACWALEDPLLAGIGSEPALLEVAGKTVAQRSLEQAVALGARRIDVVLGDQPTPYQSCLGDGERWGIAIVYHYAAPGAEPLRALARQLRGEGDVLLLHADTLLPPGCAPRPGSIGCLDAGADLRWCGWARVPGTVLHDCAAGAQSRQALGLALAADPRVRQEAMGAAASAASAAGLLAAARGLLRAPDYPVGIARRPAAPGVWIGNGARIHHRARIVAPAYIGDHAWVGPDAVIGPDAVVGARSIVERAARITASIVAPGSYVGAGVELRQALLAGRRLVNVAIGVALDIADRELAGPVADARGAAGPGVAERLLAAGLWAALWPLRRGSRADESGGAVEAIYQGAPGGWRRHFGEVFHPGLAAVARGRLRLVGPLARPAAEIAALPEAWREICLSARPGLLNEALLLGPDGADPAIRCVGDALASKKSQFGHTAGIILRYAQAVLAERSPRRPARAAAGSDTRSRHPGQQPPVLARDS